jgi:hypothetical protein
MTSTITYSGGPVMAPRLTLIQSGRQKSTAGTVSHDILDGPAVHTLRPASAVTGELHHLFETYTAAKDCFEAHRLAAVFTVADPEVDLINFAYVVQGEPEIGIDEETQELWVVVVPYQVVG